MDVKIKDNNITIKINNKIDKLNTDEILNIYAYIRAIKANEIKIHKNEYQNAFLKIEFEQTFKTIEYINIFKIIRVPEILEFSEFIKNIKKKFSIQNPDTILYLDDYFEEITIYSQEIIINIIFKLETNITTLKKDQEKILKILKISIDEL